MWLYNYPDHLAHYGVLGMKWGVCKKKKITNSELARYRKSLVSNAPNKQSRSDRRATKGYYMNMPKANLRRDYTQTNQTFENNARKLRRGSSLAVVGKAFTSTHMNRLGNYFYSKSDKKYSEWMDNAKTSLSRLKGVKVSELDVWDEMDRRKI